MNSNWKTISCTVAIALILVSVDAFGGVCPSGALAKPKSSAMYLVYLSSDDATFPEFNAGADATSPLVDFDITELDATIGTEGQLRNAVQELVEDGYCEFDVEVKTFTGASLPSPTETRWQIVGLGSDSTTSGLVGKAQAVDTGDSDAQDYARFWVAQLATFAGAELTGANSTLDRWAVGMANLILHESGHNYGASHGNSVAVAGEDATVNHFMANPALGASGSSIIDSFNHFSDTSYEVLGYNLGLNIKTLNNWDFTNPNSSNADSLTLTLLSKAASLNIAWSYNGTLSPWTSPSIVDTGGSQTFRGENYNVYELKFTTAKSWSGGANGIAPPDTKFHVGASFTESDTVIVYETTLHSGGADLALHPRMFGYDVDTAFDGSFAMTFFNTSPDDGFMVLQDVQVMFVPRMIDIESMISGAEPMGMNGRAVEPFGRVSPLKQGNIAGKAQRIGSEPLRLELARLNAPRHVDVVYDPDDCPNQQGSHPGQIIAGPDFGDPLSPDYCQDGTALSLFPASYTYVIATFVDPNAKHWDADLGDFVEGPVESRLFFQVAGIVPDMNENGIDDLLDIRDGTSVDENGNGVPDEAEPVDNGWPLWLIILIVILLIILILYFLRKRAP